MIVCPNCQAENRAGAKYCMNCASRLPESPAVTRPLNPDDTQVTQADHTTVRLGSAPVVKAARSGTTQIEAGLPFVHRPIGAIFADAYVCEAVTFTSEQLHRYLVQPLNVPEELQLRTCPNPECGTVLAPLNAAPEKYCTACGTILDKGAVNLQIVEMRTPLPNGLVLLANGGLSHGTVRAPLLTFVERLSGVPRHCLLETKVEPLSASIPMEALQALEWGEQLALGLDYLHQNGIGFNGTLDDNCLGLDGTRPVWANFSACQTIQLSDPASATQDVVALARLVFHWLTGKTQFERDGRLSPAVYRLFDRVFAPGASLSAVELAELMADAQQDTSSPRSVEHRVGRKTHVGMVRTLNEDSLLALELCRTQRSLSQPFGIFAVADGMGGHAAGEVASGAIIDVIAEMGLKEMLSTGLSSGEQGRQEWLRQAVESANQEVLALRRSSGSDMGSTLVAAVVEGNQATIVHVGDSRIYLVNSSGIRQLTTDHSLVERLVATNQISRADARYHPQRNVIYRTIGDRSRLDLDIAVHQLEVGDCLLLCSDGLSNMVDDQAMQTIVAAAESPQAACDELISAANLAGGDDNISVIIVRIVQT
jgi:PPM family protein phosphatase